MDLKNQLAQKELLLQDLQSQLKEMNQIKELYNKNVELLNQMQSNYEELNTNYLTVCIVGSLWWPLVTKGVWKDELGLSGYQEA